MDGIKIKEGNSMNNNDVLEAIDKLPDGERVFWPVPGRPSQFYDTGFTSTDLKSLATELREYRQMIEDADEIRFGRDGHTLSRMGGKVWHVPTAKDIPSYLSALDAWRATKR
jgi:hypothetical protein